MTAPNAATFDFMPMVKGYPALKFGRSGLAREKSFYLSGKHIIYYYYYIIYIIINNR